MAGKKGWGSSLKGLFVVDESSAESPDIEGAPTDPAEIERLLQSVRGDKPKPTTGAAAAPPSTPIEVPPPPRPPGASGPFQEGRSFADIYREANVPPSPYEAETLLKVLDGLRTMDVNTRKQVVAALDAADDKWTVDDPVRDAYAKIEALRQAKNQIAGSVASAEAQAAEQHRAADTYLSDASAKIRQQIDELQALLQSEVAQVTQKKAEIDAGLRATREGAARESARLDAECTRLGEIPTTFGTTPPPIPVSRS